MFQFWFYVYLIISWRLFYVISQGYVVYCPCMGRFGNQADHLLGALGFAKGLNRTLVLPPWVEYRYGEPKSRQIPFNTYFKTVPLLDYLDVVTMEDFMNNTAPIIWPPEKRIAFCFSPRGDSESCNAKQGNPFGPFWDTFSVDFVSSEFYSPLNYDVYHNDMDSKWKQRYSFDKWPVLAFVGAPASFPVQKENVGLQKYVHWNDNIMNKAKKFIKQHLSSGSFVGIHLRNGIDWQRTCKHVSDTNILFSSPQCFGYRSEYGPVTYNSCLPSKETIVKQLKRTIRDMKSVTSIFVASDNDHMRDYIQDSFKRTRISVMKYPENDPHLDLAILGRSNHFIGNCVSSFSAFVKRQRDVDGLPSSFWAFPPLRHELRDEL